MSHEQHYTDIRSLERLARKHPDDARQLQALADAYADRALWNEAAVYYHKAITVNPDNADLLNSLATVYEELEEPELAERTYRKAIEIRPGNSMPYYNLGMHYEEQHRPVEAVQIYEQLLQRSSGSSEHSLAKERLVVLRQDDSLTHYDRPCPQCSNSFSISYNICPSCERNVDAFFWPGENSASIPADQGIVGQRFGIRALAYIIDLVVLYVLTYAVGLAAGLAIGFWLALFGRAAQFQDQSRLVTLISGILLSVLYFTFTEGFFGASIGKTVLGLRVIKTDGQPCDLKAALIRALLRYIDGIFFGIVAAGSMKSPLQQRHGDRAAHTVVVSRKETAILSPRPWWRLVIATGLYIFILSGATGLQLLISPPVFTDPSLVQVHLDRAQDSMSNDDYEQAILDLQEAVDLDPSIIDSYILLGLAYGLNDQLEESVASFGQALTLNPDRPLRALIIYYRGVIQIEHGNSERAVSDIEEALDLGLPPEIQQQAETMLRNLTGRERST